MVSRLELYEAKYRSLIGELDGLGFISSGSLISRETSCGKPGCRCQGDPPRRHGPYFQWSRLKDGKTVSRRLDENEADLYRQWIANRRYMEAVISQMEEVSTKAGEILLRDAANPRLRTR
jgi:hypothetical protein